MRTKAIRLLLLLAVSSALLAADDGPPDELTGGDPGPPPPFDITQATPNLDLTGVPVRFSILCDNNWCLAMAPPEEVEATRMTHGLGCWNTAGDPFCVVSAVSEEAAGWLADYAFYQANQTGNRLCLSFDESCPIRFPGEWFEAILESGLPPGPGPTPTPPPTGLCPPATVRQEEPRAEARLLDPPYPVVAGQDPRDPPRGADLTFRIEIPPVVHTWYEPRVVDTERICVYDPYGRSSGCPGPGSQYARVVGSERGWQSFMATGDTARYWRVKGDAPRIECVRHVDVYTETLAWVQPRASLSQASRDWILRGGLQARYPGAFLYHPDWQWSPSLFGHSLPDGTWVWTWTAWGVPFRDPGQYALSLQFSTSGTPVTPPRVYDVAAGEFSVWLMEATVTR